MPSITSWSRLEPRARDPQMRNGLAARIRDPLWLLSRQWQVGEFRGHDGGSAVRVRLETHWTRLDRYRPGPADGGGPARPYHPADAPLETVVEREPVPSDPTANLRLAAEAGLHFLRVLEARGLPAAAYRQVLPVIPAEPEPELRDPATMRAHRVLAGRAPDGGALYTRIRDALGNDGLGPLPKELLLDGVDADVLRAAITAWLRWSRDLFQEPADGDTAWSGERLEYQFAVAAPSPEGDGDVVLSAPEYGGGHLDWFAFSHDPDASLSSAGAAEGDDRADAGPCTSALIVLPGPAGSRGMPAVRWWQLEDPGVNFGDVDVSPAQLARLPWLQYALLHAANWFLVPVDLPIGTLSCISRLEVTDTFGQTHVVGPAGAEDPRAPRLFQLSRAGDPAAPALDALFLPPVLGPSLHGPPLEEVRLFRDEMANMAWAVERLVEGPAGKPLDRQELHDCLQRDDAGGGSVSPELAEGAEDAYLLATTVPDHWIPLVPVRLPGTSRSIRLRRGQMLRPNSGDDAISGLASRPMGRIIGGDEPLLLYDEQIPRAGVRFTRAFQYARWSDGSAHLWIGRRRGPGRGEGSSGLRYDETWP